MNCLSYDESFYQSKALNYWAKAYNRILPSNVTVLISSGASGCSIASAMLAISRRKDLKHIHVHPKTRVSHKGDKKQFSGPQFQVSFLDKFYFSFVDDLIDTGATSAKCIKEFKTTFENGELHSVLVGYSCCNTEGETANLFKVPVYFANGNEAVFPEKDLTSPAHCCTLNQNQNSPERNDKRKP